MAKENILVLLYRQFYASFSQITPYRILSNGLSSIRELSLNIILQVNVCTHASFSETLSSITPTFSELTAFKDLLHYASTPCHLCCYPFLSLQRTITSSCSSSLSSIKCSLILNHVFLLLFALTREYVDKLLHSMSMRSLRRKSSKNLKESKRPWAAGFFLDRETWPPVGADLSFFLRTVIVDSLEKGR